MSTNKIGRLLSSKFFYFVNVVLIFVFAENTIVAQIDSLNTDTSKVLIKEPLVVNDSIQKITPSDSIVYLGADTSFLAPQKRKIIPARATLYSLLLPGLGQAYNGKYWKIPIIYTIFGTMYYFAADNNQKYQDFKFAYKNFGTDLQPEWVKTSNGIDATYLKKRMEHYKRNRDFNIILGGIFYLLNVLDANVDAHLMDFDVSEDLSLRIEPDIIYYQAAKKNSNVSGFGIKFVLSLNR